MGLTERYFQMGSEQNVIHLRIGRTDSASLYWETGLTSSVMRPAFGFSIMGEISC